MTDSVERYRTRHGEAMRCRRCGMSAALAPDGLWRCEAPPAWCARHAIPGREQVVSSAIPASRWKVVTETEQERAAIQGEAP